MSFSSDVWPLTELEYRSDAGKARAALLEERSKQIVNMPLPLVFHGYCAVCRTITPIEFRANFGVVDEMSGSFNLAYSETGACCDCGANSRQRLAVELLGALPRSADVYMTEHFTPLREKLGAQYPNLVSSEYLGDHASGARIEEIRHENLHALSFASESLDAVLCLDVLEHVNDPVTCIGEITRVLRPGGRAVVSFPFFAHRHETVRRSELVDGAVVHLLPAEYHGNPLGGGSLVFSELAWDFVERAGANPAADTRMLQYWSAYGLHLGGARTVLVVDKR